METLSNSTGFFGPSLLADITLVTQILFFLILSAGVVAQLLEKYKLHARLQGPVVILNLLLIIFVMFPKFQTVSGEFTARLSDPPVIVTVIHAALGIVAQLLALYCLLAGIKILPQKSGSLRYWMWLTYTAWTATVIFGISVYIFSYTRLVP